MPRKYLHRPIPGDLIDQTQWPFNLVTREPEDYDFSSYEEDIPREIIAQKFPSEAELNKYLGQLQRDKFFQTVQGQLRQPIDEDEFKNLTRLIKKVERIIYERNREQGLLHSQIKHKQKDGYKEFLASARPVLSYHGKPYVLDKTQVRRKAR